MNIPKEARRENNAKQSCWIEKLTLGYRSNLNSRERIFSEYSCFLKEAIE